MNNAAHYQKLTAPISNPSGPHQIQLADPHPDMEPTCKMTVTCRIMLVSRLQNINALPCNLPYTNKMALPAAAL